MRVFDNVFDKRFLDEFANTSSAGSLIAYHRHNDLKPGDKGIICSFGGGYSICSILVEK